MRRSEPAAVDPVSEPADAVPIRVALLHPKQAMVDALEVLLAPRPGIQVVAAHTDVDWIRHAVAAGKVDVLLINVDHEAASPALIESLRRSSEGLGVVAITDADKVALLAEVVRAGVRGWVGRDASADHLVEVVRGVHRGETWLPPAAMTKLLETLLASEESRRHAWGAIASLSSREREVLECLIRGLTRQQIADRFVLSPHTVRTHINNVLRKLGVHSTLAAVSIARQAGLGRSDNGQRPPD
jgi:DNA-binding NarL/FixJ family response regulator